MSGRTVTAADGAVVAVHELGTRGIPALLTHAAGFHGLVLAPLAALLDGDAACVAVDLRGHGDSSLPPGGTLDWPGMGADALAAVDGLGLSHPFGVGHSSGATALLLAEQARPGTFRALYLYEPVLVAADPPLGTDTANWLADRARRRRDVFASRAEALAHYGARPPLSTLAPEALAAYVDHGFEDTPDGTVRLKCRPEVEASVYETATAHDGWGRLREVACPVLVTCGSASDACTPEVAAAQAARMPRAASEVVVDVGHFGPMERPDLVAASVRRFLAGVAR